MIKLSYRDITAEQNDKLNKLKGLVDEFGGIDAVLETIKSVSEKGGIKTVWNLLTNKQASLYAEAGIWDKIKKLTTILLLAASLFGFSGNVEASSYQEQIKLMQTYQKAMEHYNAQETNPKTVSAVHEVIERRVFERVKKLIELGRENNSFSIGVGKASIKEVKEAISKFYDVSYSKLPDNVTVRRDRVTDWGDKITINFKIRISDK